MNIKYNKKSLVVATRPVRKTEPAHSNYRVGLEADSQTDLLWQSMTMTSQSTFHKEPRIGGSLEEEMFAGNTTDEDVVEGCEIGHQPALNARKRIMIQAIILGDKIKKDY